MSETLELQNYEQTAENSPNGNGQASAESPAENEPFDGRYSEFTQKINKINGHEAPWGAHHVWGINAETGKKEHLSHDSVLAAYGYGPEDAPDTEPDKPKPKEPIMPVTPTDPTTPRNPFEGVVADAEASKNDAEKAEQQLELARSIVKAFRRTQALFGKADYVAQGRIPERDAAGRVKRDAEKKVIYKKIPAELKETASNLRSQTQDAITVAQIGEEGEKIDVLAHIEHEGMPTAIKQWRPPRPGERLYSPDEGFIGMPEDGSYRVRFRLEHADGTSSWGEGIRFPWLSDQRRVTPDITTNNMPEPGTDGFAQLEVVAAKTNERMRALQPRVEEVFNEATAT